VLEALGSEEKCDECYVAGIHSLEGEPGGGTVEVRIVDELLDGFQNLLQKRTLHETEFQHFDRGLAKRRLGFCLKMVWGFERKWKGKGGKRIYIEEGSGSSWRDFGGCNWIPARSLMEWAEGREIFQFFILFFYRVQGKSSFHKTCEFLFTLHIFLLHGEFKNFWKKYFFELFNLKFIFL